MSIPCLHFLHETRIHIDHTPLINACLSWHSIHCGPFITCYQFSQKYPNWWNIGCFWEWCKIDGNRKLNFLVLTPAYSGTLTPYITRTAASKLLTMWDILVIIFHEEWLKKIMSVSVICMGHDSSNWRYLTSIEGCSCYKLVLCQALLWFERKAFTVQNMQQWTKNASWFSDLGF